MIDLIVVGAGPAGCAASIWGAKNGLCVTLVESGKETYKPGESLHPGVFALLKMLDLNDEIESASFLRFDGQFVSWGHPKVFQPFGKDENGSWRGVHIPRNRFESILKRKAISVGVKLLQPCVAIAPLVENSRIVGVQTQTGNIHSRYVIDATGSKSWLTRNQNLPMHFESTPLTAFYGFTDTRGIEKEMGAFLESHTSGWSWVARTDTDVFSWVALMLHKINPGNTNLIPKMLKDCMPLGRVKGSDVTWRFNQRPAGPGFFVIGDAAAVLDPLSSDGVIRAMLSGIQAAYLSKMIMTSKISEASAVELYRQWIESLFVNEMGKLKELYGIFIPEHDFILKTNRN